MKPSATGPSKFDDKATPELDIFLEFFQGTGGSKYRLGAVGLERGRLVFLDHCRPLNSTQSVKMIYNSDFGVCFPSGLELVEISTAQRLASDSAFE